ncbi:hypothetical protein AWV79_33965 [Cupriavidus sp. UYMMa02A]|nr:hypothetical protein AWV79_33965 [Cupriavidus sp. UYMMa02A]
MPDVPTVAEAGLAGYEVSSWFALAAPKGMPQKIVDALSKASNEAKASPEFAQKLADFSIQPSASSTPASTRKLVFDEIKRWAPLVGESGAAKN